MNASIGILPVTATDIANALADEWGRALEHDLLPGFLATQRWFGAKDQRIGSVSLTPLAEVETGCMLCIVDVELNDEKQQYFLPLAVKPGQKGAILIASVEGGGALVDGASVPEIAQTFLDAMRAGLVLPVRDGEVRFYGTPVLGQTVAGAPKLLAVEQSNASVLFGQEIILKIYRRLRHGVQPDVEMTRYLTEQGKFPQTPAYLGSMDLHENGDVTTLAAAFAFVPNRGDAWAHLTNLLANALTADQLNRDTGTDLIRCLGQRTGELHRVLACSTDDPAFQPEPVTSADLVAWVAETQDDLTAALDSLAGCQLDPHAEVLKQQALAARDDLSERIARLADLPPSGQRTRIHGDYHLGQVLVSGDDVAIIDFEGEPRRSLAARRAKTAPLRDVAGMIRSLDYAARSAAKDQADPKQAQRLTVDWYRHAVVEYLSAYSVAMKGVASQPDGEMHGALLDLFLIQKTAYEIGYELANRPAWTHLPLAGLIALIEDGHRHD